ncbi:MAG: lysophospholipid acyltransferase family protein [Sneathiella sp.]
MRLTIYRTPIINHFFIGLAWVSLKLFGWKLIGIPPKEKKYVLLAAPHTSNWDFPIMVALAFTLQFEIYWMGKAALFWGPAGPIMKWFGGIPIRRERAHGIVNATIDAFHTHERLIIIIPPEGTRSKVENWKEGFYHIAIGAQVPIGLGFLDFKRKVGGFGPTFYPTGDMARDIPKIQEFYKTITPKFPDQSSTPVE